MDRIEYIKQHLSIPKLFDLVILQDMGDYYNDYTVDFDLKSTVKCPLHSEDTPSFRYFRDTESFYCYGCARGGDVIHLYKEHLLLNHNVVMPFEKLENELYRLACDEGEKVVRRKLGDAEETVELNSSQDLLKFNIYLNRWLGYINRKLEKMPALKYALMSEIYTYRDGVYGQGIKVAYAIDYLEELVRKV